MQTGLTFKQVYVLSSIEPVSVYAIPFVSSQNNSSDENTQASVRQTEKKNEIPVMFHFSYHLSPERRKTE